MHWCKCENKWVETPRHKYHINCKCKSSTLEPIKLEPLKPMKFEPIKYEPIKYEPLR